MFDLVQYESRFKFKNLREFDIEESRYRYDFGELSQLSLEDYQAVFQTELPYKNVERYPYYFYSLQNQWKSHSSIAILHYKEGIYTEISLITHDEKGKKVDELLLTEAGGDGAWTFGTKSKYLNDSSIQSYSYEWWEEENDTAILSITKKYERRYSIGSMGNEVV